MKKIVNGICVAAGFAALGLGMLGIILPVLPTTPFLLLAAALFAKGSERFHIWFMNTSMYKKYVEPAVRKKEMTAKRKCCVLGLVTVLLCVGFVMSPVWYARAVILIVLAGHYYYFLCRIRTVKEMEPAEE